MSQSPLEDAVRKANIGFDFGRHALAFRAEGPFGHSTIWSRVEAARQFDRRAKHLFEVVFD